MGCLVSVIVTVFCSVNNDDGVRAVLIAKQRSL